MRKKNTGILVVLCFLFISNFYCQNPGNVGTTNLTAWFKPDGLALGNVTSWSTTLSSVGGVTVTDAAAPFPLATNTPIGNVSNYNKTLFFSGNSATNLQALQFTGSLNLLQNNSIGAQGTFFCAYYFPNVGSSNNHMMLYNQAPHGIQFRNLGTTGRIGIGLSSSNSNNASRDWTEDFAPSIISYKGNRSTATSMTAYEQGATFPSVIASQSTGNQGLYFGFYPSISSTSYNGFLHEFIFYDRDLTTLEISKVHSYLALKYGATLVNTGGGSQGDYLATTGSIVWDASVNPTYHHNVIGIGRDDAQSLMQKQSHAFNDNYRIYISNLANSNDANSGTIANDLSYITMGQNTASSCGTIASNAEAPAGIQSRIAKEWKVTNTNFNQNFNWDLKLDTCSMPGATVGAVDVANFRLLVDADGNFTDATIFPPSASLTFAYSNGIVSVNGISTSEIAINSTAYISIAYNALGATFSGNNLLCTGDSSLITVHISGTSGPLTIAYTDGTSTFTLPNAMDGDNFYLSPTITTTYNIIGANNFLNCCGGINGSALTLTVNPLPSVVANASASTICANDSTFLYGSGTTSSYVWNNGAMNADSISPATTTTFTVIGTNANGCQNMDSITVTVNPNPIVTANTSVSVLCVGDSVIVTGAGATTYIWDNAVTNNIPFYPNATTTYQVIGLNGFNCWDTASIEIVVNELPDVVANSLDTIICIYFSTTVFGTGATSYIWNNGALDNVSMNPLVTTTYTVIGTDANNCQNVDSITVVVNPQPVVAANASESTICDNENTQLTGSGANSYVWDNSVTDGEIIGPNTATTYTVIGTDLNGCGDTASVTITINPSPSVVANTTNNNFCAGENITLSGSGATTYLWDNGVINNNSFTLNSSTTFTVIGTNSLGCVDTSSILITVLPLPNVVANATMLAVCLGEFTTLSGAGAVSYNWDNGIVDGVAFAPTLSATYTVIGTDANNCQNTDDIFITVYPEVDFYLGDDDTICPQKPIVLFPNTNFAFYQWSTGSNFPQIEVNYEGVFTLTVEDNNGCTYTDDQVITLGDDCFSTLYIPNTFTPNGDEHNQYLRTTGDELDKFQIQIYNRWGELVFTSFDINQFWDGTYNNQPCSDGIYTYVVRYSTSAGNDEKLIQHGHIQLIR